MNTFLILSCTPVGPQNSLNLSGAWTLQSLKVIHRDAGPCCLQGFSQLCQVGWKAFGWWIFHDTHRKLFGVKNPAALQFLTHSNWSAWHLLPFKGTENFGLANSPSEWHTHTIHVSRLKNPSLTSPPLIDTD
jgi:hypothetical protein